MKNQSLNEDSDEFSVQLCLTHKRNIEFNCINKKCRFINQGVCSKCLMKNEIHYQCDLIEPTNEQDQGLDRTARKTIHMIEYQINELKKKIDTFFKKGKNFIFRQMLLGNEAAQETASHILELLKEINSNESEDQQSKSLILGDIWAQFEEFTENHQSESSQSKESSVSKNISINDQSDDANSRSGYSILDQSSISQKDDTSSISNISSSSRKRVQLLKRSFPQENMINEVSSFSVSQLSSLTPSSKSSSISQTISQKNSKNGCQSKQISLADKKHRDPKKYPIESQYIDTFCLFETKSSANAIKNQQIMENDTETGSDSSLASKQYFLLTRCEKQMMQVYDLQEMKEILRISFTNDNEIIHFKQISHSEVIIFSPNNNYLWIQNIFDEKKFSQIDFKFNIDCIECDKEQGLIFIGHQLGKISVWCAQTQQAILSGYKIHSKKINLMDYLEGRLITCCDSESVKEFSFSRSNPQLLQKQIYRKELISDDPLEFISNIKIINDDTIMVHVQNEFFEIYKNGLKLKNDDTLEILTCLQDMKIYDKRFGLMRSSEDENIVCIYDFVDFQYRKPIKLLNCEDVIIGAYYLNNHLILLLEDQLIIKYS